MAKSNHLTENQLQELKDLLLKEYGEIQHMIEVIDAQDPFNDPDHTDYDPDDSDIQEQLGHETVEAELKTLKKRFTLVEEALRRMDAGTYGLDVQSGEPIDFERLRVMPEAQHTVENEKRLVS